MMANTDSSDSIHNNDTRRRKEPQYNTFTVESKV